MIFYFSSAVVPCPTVQISGTHISLHTHWTWCYINTFYEIFDHQNMGLDVISIHAFLSLNDILQEHFFRIMAD